MTKTERTAARVAAYRARGWSFRRIETRLRKTLGLRKPGNGTKAFRAVNTYVAVEMIGA